MAIPESQLNTWSGQGSIQQSKTTYATVKGVLESINAPYCSKSYDSFLQGSYGNDTNVYADSDVDVVMRLTSTYYYDVTRLSQPLTTSFHAATGGTAPYGVPEFKSDVTAWLLSPQNFGTLVKPGSKAVFIAGYGNRRDCDVLVCAAFRRYMTFTGSTSDYHEGICFFASDGTRIENFPKQHSANCTAKHQGTKYWFKPTVRVFKNMRNRMIEKGVLKEGVAPSYFLEGMLWNVPDDKFGGSYQDTFVNCFNWVLNADSTKLTTASGLHWLIRDNEHTSWPRANFKSYMDAAGAFWKNW